MTDLDALNELIIRYNLQFHAFDASTLGWKVSKSQIAGKGLVATRKYKPGQTIFVDHPLVVGPRYIADLKPFCVVCYGGQNLRSCSRECRLPVCSAACERSDRHEAECGYLRGLNEDEGAAPDWDPNRFKAVTAVRCLAFDELARKIVSNLHKIRSRARNEECYFEFSSGAVHNVTLEVPGGVVAFLKRPGDVIHDIFWSFEEHKPEISNSVIHNATWSPEVNLLKDHVKKKLKPEDEHFMQQCCRVLDANAFEVLLPASIPNHEQVALRGLYPVASILNHSCRPNTTHHFNEDCQMIVKASNVILPGCEITSTYSPLLLGTAARRSFLAFSKEFYCKCLRCKDPSEYGTYLTALKCRNTDCNSALLPTEPLDFHSTWQCVRCESVLTANKIAVLQKAVAGELSRFDNNEPQQIIEFINGEKFTAATNHIVVQFKYVLLKLLGYVEGYEYSKLNENQLQLKKQICEEILTIVSKLSLGQCEIKGSCLHELAMTNHEIKKRKDRKEPMSNTK